VVFEKLVRDRIPEIIQKSGGQPVTRILTEDAEYLQALEQKLDEETGEFHESKSLEELADLLEVIYALTEATGHSREELQEAFDAKHRSRGGFSQRIFLISKKEK